MLPQRSAQNLGVVQFIFCAEAFQLEELVAGQAHGDFRRLAGARDVEKRSGFIFRAA
jgi:hypothetical protein